MCIVLGKLVNTLKSSSLCTFTMSQPITMIIFKCPTPRVPGTSWPIGPWRRQTRADLTAKGTHHPHLPLGGVAKCARPSLLLLGLKACTAVRFRPVRWPTLGAAELPAALAERGRFFATGIDIRTPWTGGGSGSRPGVGGASSAPAPVGLPRGVGVALHVADERIERQHLLSCTSLESTTPRLCVCGGKV